MEGVDVDVERYVLKDFRFQMGLKSYLVQKLFLNWAEFDDCPRNACQANQKNPVFVALNQPDSELCIMVAYVNLTLRMVRL